MRTSIYNSTHEFDYFNRFFEFEKAQDPSVRSHNPISSPLKLKYKKEDISPADLLTHEARLQIQNGQLPDFVDVCRDLYKTFHLKNAPYSAHQFEEVLERLPSFDDQQLKALLKNPETRHVLVANRYMKVVLIHWKPGSVSDIHGHPEGGCMFKVLKGRVQELRYTTGHTQDITEHNEYKEGGVAYIDDNQGYHSVGSLFGTAVTLHVYTPGTD